MFNKPQNWLLGIGLATAMMTVSQTAQAAIIDLGATLDGIQSGTGSPGTGTAMMLYDTEMSKLIWNIEFDGLTGNLTVAHFHGPAEVGNNAGVQVTIVGSGDSGSSPLMGMMTMITPEQEAQLLSGLWYINLHTDTFPSGEIRGQVTVNTVPEPSTLGFLAMTGVTFLGYQLRKKRLG